MAQSSGRHQGLRSPPPWAVHQAHRGQAVPVGTHTIFLGGTHYLEEEDLRQADVLIPLTETALNFGSSYNIIGTADGIAGMPPLELGRPYQILAAPLKDFGGVPENWASFLREQVVPLLACGQKVLAFCIGSHGRTGTLLASLIAILEPEVLDPIAAARERHCAKAVETLAQARAVFALRGQELPACWQGKFHC